MSLSPREGVESFRELIQQKRKEIRESRERTKSQASETPVPIQDLQGLILSTDATSVNSAPPQNLESSKILLTKTTQSNDNDDMDDDAIETSEAFPELHAGSISPSHERSYPTERLDSESQFLSISPSTGSGSAHKSSRLSPLIDNLENTESESNGEVDCVKGEKKLTRKDDINIKRPLQQLDSASFGRIPKRKKPWGETEDGEVIPSPNCQCAVRNNCPHIPQGRIDCRTYAPQPKGPSQKQVYLAYHNVNFEKQNGRKLSDIINFSRYQKRLEDCRQEDIEDAIGRFGYWLDTMRFFEMNQSLLDNSKILQKLRYFLSSDYPFKDRIKPELRDDLTMLKHRWRDKDFDPDIHRGIKHRQMVGKEAKRLTRKLDQDYQHLRDPHFYGMGKLVNGQCWLNQLELVRDGVHGQTEGGIYGDTDTGARSIVLSCPEGRDDYADRDMGNVIHYMGTSQGNDDDGVSHDGDARRVTRATEVMFASIKSQRPIRVIRAWRLHEISRRRPVNGFRLDGLYEAINAECVDAERAVWRFRLERLPKQTRIRTDLPSRRQLEEFARRRIQEETVRKEHGASSGRRLRGTKGE